MSYKFSWVIASGLFATLASIAPAQAFTTFTFNTSYSPKPADPTKDIKLESVTLGDTTVNSFNLVNRANILVNNLPAPIPGQSVQGPGSSDAGTNTGSDPLLPEGPVVESPTEANIVASLGNLNLNSIIDTEDKWGTSSFNLFFDQPSDHFFLYERGMNSDLLVEAIDASGNLLGESFKITRDLWASAGYSIMTHEIADQPQPQAVGSFGLKTKTTIAGLRLTSFNSNPNSFNGPDYKVVAAKVPEPTVLLGLAMAGGSLPLLRRRKLA
ncbi:MAG: hypothetical protein B0A82_12075 [Alkalinema sp. CACIAM 70d]|nr:MAG: hypothetical protein B0A82_12075 [Alkalinema sp. CACIAM 70d]